MQLSKVTYIWIDGSIPTKTLRSKVRICPCPNNKQLALADLPQWNFDGSSTNQAVGHDSDLTLQPICLVQDPISGAGHYLALCEVLNPDGTPHETNKRAQLVKLMEKAAKDDPWIGFEQEFTLFNGQQPLGWPDRGYPAPQGPFYCGVGADEVFGRYLIEEHTQACLDAGIMLYGTNAEVMPGQWEFQVGYRGLDSESADPITVSDHLWLARWLLYRLGEKYGISATLHPKPIKGDWNGAGKHTNFSTRMMRDPKTGMSAIHKAIKALEARHTEHIAVYGHDLELRLTGRHETAHISQFIAGVGHRGASVRIPRPVEAKGCGYLEDRRPGANANPYEVAAILVETLCCNARVPETAAG